MLLGSEDCRMASTSGLDLDDTDTRGWFMTVISGIGKPRSIPPPKKDDLNANQLAACVIGASIICVDVALRHFPRWKNFSIQDSSLFLASSMSLSFGVMIFSALYSILPSSLRYLLKADIEPKKASWILLGCFAGGFIGIQTISRFLHHYMPSHVVDCDHTHAETPNYSSRQTSHSVAPTLHAHSDGHVHPHTEPHRHSHSHSRVHTHDSRHSSHAHAHAHNHASESTPLLTGGRIRGRSVDQRRQEVPPEPRRPSMAQVQSRVFSFVTDQKTNCDEAGPCYGYSEPCGRKCFKHFASTRANSLAKAPTFLRRQFSAVRPPILDEDLVLSDHADETRSPCCKSRSDSQATATPATHGIAALDEDINCASDPDCDMEVDLEAQNSHHHHVPENAFMSIGLQTSIAIALHKLPEGFITYATNHASPALGFSVFMALFIHNITEGFALALPLYLALGSKLKAMLWASLLGGISQPLGAGIAAFWFWVQGRGHGEGDEADPGFVVYGCMFAITGGIMTSVALQLFVEGVSMSHRKEICIGAAVAGMCLLAGSNALTA